MTYDNWKATNPADEELGSAKQGRRQMTYEELNEMALKAESGADWAEICRLEAEMLARQKRDLIGRIQFKSAGVKRER